MPLSDALAVALAAKPLPLSGRLRWFREFSAWQRGALRETVPHDGPADVTAILLSYRRPQNIRPIVRSLLRVPRIRRVIVSNNNCRTNLPPGLGLRDPRVRVVQQQIDRPTHVRQQIALLDDAPYFLLVDDDLFCTPTQIDQLLRHLKSDPASPHGLIGELYDPWLDRMYHNVRDHEGPIDIFNCIYAVTREHIIRFFDRVDRLGFNPTHPAWLSSFWDDMVMSISGTAPTKLHRLGPIPFCPTSGIRDIAACASDGFFHYRMKLMQRFSAMGLV